MRRLDSRFWWLVIVAGLVLFAAGLSACGLSSRVETLERWYPTYSHYRVTRPDVIVFIHGYGGSEETFAVVPFLAARFPQRTIMYFNYDTGALRGELDSFSVIAQDFRDFLHSRVLSREASARKVAVICHSTGCPIIRQYVADHPFDHGVDTIVMVAGANYGAYYSESTSKIKQFLPWAHGDKQIQELKYGSFSLFYLQLRWHHLWEKAIRLGEGKRAHSEWLRSTPFSEFAYVVDKDQDERYLDGHWDRQKPPLRLPSVIAVVGTDSWQVSGARKFSDGVVRAESAIVDCRVLRAAPPGFRQEALGPDCADRLVVFVPCFHTGLFSQEPCQTVLLDVLETFVLSHPDAKSEQLRQGFADRYRAAVGRDALGQYLSHLDSAALWVHISLRAPAVPGALPVEVGSSDLNRLRVNLAGVKRTAPWPVGLFESDFSEAVRSLKTGPERIDYFKYIAAQPEGTDVDVQILLDCPTDGAPTCRRLSMEPVGEVPRQPADSYRLRLFPGETAMLTCRNKRDSLTELACEEVTAGRLSTGRRK